jgi:hypothetical protein
MATRESRQGVSNVEIIIARLSGVSQKHRAQQDMKVLPGAVRFGTWYIAGAEPEQTPRVSRADYVNGLCKTTPNTTALC